VNLDLLEIIVDKREPNDTLEKVQKICPLAKFDILEAGDIGYKQVCIELKSWSDFVIALTSKKDDRFRRQLYNFLINKDIDAYYMIYGDWSEINDYSHIGMTAVLGAIASIQARYGMRLSVLPNKDYAIYVALKIIEKTYDHKDIRPVTYRVGSDERAIDGLVAVGERVGSEDGIRLLEHFGNFKNVINATEKEMVKVHKIGKIKAKNILKVVNYDFKSKAEFEEAIDEEFGLIDAEKDKIENIPEPIALVEIEEDVAEIEEKPIKKKKIPKKKTTPKKKPLVNNDTMNDWSKEKKIVFGAIELYSKKKGKPCPYETMEEKLNISKTTLKIVLNDLIMESKVYMVDEGLYDVY